MSEVLLQILCGRGGELAFILAFSWSVPLVVVHSVFTGNKSFWYCCVLDWRSIDSRVAWERNKSAAQATYRRDGFPEGWQKPAEARKTVPIYSQTIYQTAKINSSAHLPPSPPAVHLLHHMSSQGRSNRCVSLAAGERASRVPYPLCSSTDNTTDPHREDRTTLQLRPRRRQSRQIRRLCHSITTSLHDPRQLMARRYKIHVNRRLQDP